MATIVILVAAAFALRNGTPTPTRAAPTSPAHATTTTTTTPATTLAVTSLSPAPGTQGVDPGTPIAVHFSAPVAPTAPLPTLTPAVAGSWVWVTPTWLQYLATDPLPTSTTLTLTIPSGVRTVTGAALTAPVTAAFTTTAPSPVRANQLLAELGYLPLTFTPATPLTSPAQEATPQEGSYAWRWPSVTPALVGLWDPAASTVVTRGALMTFQDQHTMTADGVLGPATWQALLQAAQSNATNLSPYDYVTVSLALPQHIVVYSNGAVATTSPANTGVAGATTDPGTFPVYLRYKTTTMSGTNPDGSHYSDPGIPWVSYFNRGDALHGFVRSSYGFPQSVGCVELPPTNAGVVWPLTPLGTLVTVA